MTTGGTVNDQGTGAPEMTTLNNTYTNTNYIVATEVDDEDLEPEKERTKEWVEAEEVCNHLKDRLAQSIEKYRPPTEAAFRGWVKEIERAIRLDGRTKEELIQVIDFIHDVDTFWIPNIMSGKKLREQFDVIWFKMKSNKPKVNIRDRVRKLVKPGKPFFTLNGEEGKVELCIYGDQNALYDYHRNKYIDKEAAVKYWEVIEKNFDTIFKEKKL